MRKLTPVELPAWALPLIVVAVIVPIIGAVLLGGPAAGFIAGAAVAATIIVLAARARYDEPIEVAPAGADSGYHLLVVVTEPADDPPVVEAIADAAAHGASSEVLVLAPALNPRLPHWLSDLGNARLGAQERLALTLAALAAARVEATGRVGDTDPVQAVEDTLASFPAQEVIFVTASGEDGDVSEVRRRLDRPLRHLEAERR
ncbi:MAG: hypothetical protein ACRDMA_05935 [Solirubrobacterales bacterium]